MHIANRFLGALFLMAALVASVPIETSATPQEGVQVRIYDSGHHDYHRWDEREDHAYRGYLKRRHEEYHTYATWHHKQQSNYWNWRHSHPDHD